TLITDFLAVEPQSVAMLELYGELYGEKGDADNAVAQYGKAIELLLEHPEPGMPTLHEELFEKVTALAPDSPTAKKLAALMHGAPMEAPPVPVQPEPAVSPVVAAPSIPVQDTSTFSIADAAPDDARSLTSTIAPQQDRHFSLAGSEPDPVPDLEPVQSVEPEPVTPSSGFSFSIAEPVAEVPIEPLLSTSEQFQAYVAAGQHAEAEEWLSRLVTAEPHHSEARELFGYLLEIKGDTAGAALQYSRALELLLADPEKQDAPQPAILYAKVKELAPASPLVAKWAATFSPKTEVTIQAVEAPVCPAPADPVDPETHYTLGVAYKNMGLLDEAKEEFACAMKGSDFFLDSCLMIAVCLKEQGEGQLASQQLELLLQNPKCQGAKAQAISYELGLLYEAQERWSHAAIIYQTIPTFHDVPQRLDSVRVRLGTAQAPAPAPELRYAN
ncbi:MAG: hypothetical protein HOP00_07405, partial [Nitrospira sp.]|nr:hypothetical protein [Nitrospira sp.]